ncbi:MAG: nickel-dependent hydrogenase large subunit [Polyangiaceae bacterium]|nr:nickel-dependent hydrogenase large subunit [Polyangiaceae bacterium]
MADVGKLEFGIAWDGEMVRDATITSTRPRADRVLEGRTAQEAVKLVSLLFSVCGKAQSAAAEAAMAVAQGREPTQTHSRAVACEAMQEHLWRLLLDWPALLGLPKRQEIFVRLHGALNAIAAGAGDTRALSDELHRTLTGMTSEEWARLDSYAALIEWSQGNHGSCAPVVAALDALESVLSQGDAIETCDLLPEWSTTELDRFRFDAQPHWGGRPMETGALAYWQHEPLLRDILRQRQSRLLARLVARVHDLLDSANNLARERTAQRIQCFALEANAGLGLVRTARGMLLHYTRIERGHIAQCCIVAPTEWNFHPRGAWRAGLMNLRERDAARVMEIARRVTLSLDPCAEYTIKMRHA